MATVQTGFVSNTGVRTFAPKHLAAACGLFGVLFAALFSFVIYPRIAGPAGAVLDPDQYGALGWGLFKFHTFSFYPNTEPTIARGPLYPMVVAAVLYLSPASWPLNMQLVQDLWCGITC